MTMAEYAQNRTEQNRTEQNRTEQNAIIAPKFAKISKHHIE